MEVIDLRIKGKGCTEHPIIRFTQVLRELSRSRVKEVTVIVNEKDIPLKFIELFAKSQGVRLVDINKHDDKTLIVRLTST